MSQEDRLSIREAAALRILNDQEYLVTPAGIKLMPLKYAAQVADISGGTLSYAIASGKIKGYRFPSCDAVMLSVKEVAEYLRSSKLGRPKI